MGQAYYNIVKNCPVQRYKRYEEAIQIKVFSLFLMEITATLQKVMEEKSLTNIRKVLRTYDPMLQCKNKNPNLNSSASEQHP